MKRILLLIATSTFSVAYFSQGCSDLFFSEYIEGSGDNKALEIYNPTAQNINLSTYRIYKYTNGASTATDTIKLSGTINAGDVYIAAAPNADPTGIASKSDTLHILCTFNGDDAIALYKGTTMLDVIGVIGTDPGSSWSVDTGSTKEHTLIRKATIYQGTTIWVGDGELEWTSYNQNDFTFLGSHTADACVTNNLVSNPMVDDNSVCKGATVNFTESSTGGTAPYSYDWNFGDGSTHGTTSSVSHVYTTAGTYNVVLTITDQSFVGQVDDATITVVVDACSFINETKVNEITIFPNPTKNGIVNLSNIEMNSQITIFNVIGEMVYNATLNKDKQLNLESLNKGSYFISIVSENNKITKKLIIE